MNVMSIMFFPTHTCKKCGIWHRLRHSYSSEGNFSWRLCHEENRVTDVITPLLTSVVQAVKPRGNGSGLSKNRCCKATKKKLTYLFWENSPVLLATCGLNL